MYSREEVVKLARLWIGLNEKDGSYKEIIDIYNSASNRPRNNLKMQYDWSWCACFWSALSIALGYREIMPIEISCGNLIEEAKKMGIWVEADNYIPGIGDGIVYDWDDSGKGDCTGWPDHIGVIDSVNRESGYMVAIEGNYSNSVKRRTISLNGRYIRGFITPKYDNIPETLPPVDPKPNKSNETVAREVIAGHWGSGDERKQKLTAAGYAYGEVQRLVNQILNGNLPPVSDSPRGSSQTEIKKTVRASCAAKKFYINLAGTYRVTAQSGLYCRNDAGTNKRALCKIPYGCKVECFGYYNLSKSTRWLYVQFVLDNVQYTGFCSSDYLKRIL